MASIEALARRRGQALERLSAVSREVAGRFGVEPPSFQVDRRDPELGRVQLVEQAAAFLESLVSAVDSKDGAEGAERAAETPLPEDFPGHSHLTAEGVETVEAVKALGKAQLVALPGIGPATADRIIAAAKKWR